MYRKFSADYLFTGHELLPAGMVLVTDENGTIAEIVSRDAAGEGVEHFAGLLTPGFVNAHCHLELSHLKGVIPEHTGLIPFVQQVMTKRYAPEAEMQQAMQDACAEMSSGGIVAVGDICNTTNSISAKQQSDISWHNFIELTGFVDAVAEKRFEEGKLVATAFGNLANNDHRSTFNAQRSTTFSPHAPYSVSATLFDFINKETAGQLVSIHNQETPDENIFFEKKEGAFLQIYEQLGVDISHFKPTGKTSLQSFWPFFNQGQTVMLVHNTFVSQADIDFIKKGYPANDQRSTFNVQPFFCLCPNANLYIENRLPPVDLLRSNNMLMVLGTDSYASNWQLSILEEMKTLQRTLDLPLAELLKWGTLNGAIALHKTRQLGSFDKGKTPGVVLIDKLEEMKFAGDAKARRIL